MSLNAREQEVLESAERMQRYISGAAPVADELVAILRKHFPKEPAISYETQAVQEAYEPDGRVVHVVRGVDDGPRILGSRWAKWSEPLEHDEHDVAPGEDLECSLCESFEPTRTFSGEPLKVGIKSSSKHPLTELAEARNERDKLAEELRVQQLRADAMQARAMKAEADFAAVLIERNELADLPSRQGLVEARACFVAATADVDKWRDAHAELVKELTKVTAERDKEKAESVECSRRWAEALAAGHAEVERLKAFQLAAGERDELDELRVEVERMTTDHAQQLAASDELRKTVSDVWQKWKDGADEHVAKLWRECTQAVNESAALRRQLEQTNAALAKEPGVTLSAEAVRAVIEHLEREKGKRASVPQVEADGARTATITVDGPVGCGKSAVLFRIEEMLRKEFGASTRHPELDLERRMSGRETPDWLRECVAKTVWTLTEQSKRPKQWEPQYVLKQCDHVDCAVNGCSINPFATKAGQP